MSLVIRVTHFTKGLLKNLTGEKAGNVAKILKAIFFPLKVETNGAS